MEPKFGQNRSLGRGGGREVFEMILGSPRAKKVFVHFYHICY